MGSLKCLSQRLLAFLLLTIHLSSASLGNKRCNKTIGDCDPDSEYCDHFESVCKSCSVSCSEDYKHCFENCPSYVGRVVKENLSNADQIKSLQIILAIVSAISILTLLMVILLFVLRIKDRRKICNTDDSKDKDAQMHQVMQLKKVHPGTLPSLRHGTSMQTVTTRVSEYGSSLPQHNGINGGRMPSEDTVNERVSSPDVETVKSLGDPPSPSNQGPFTISNSQII